MNLNYLNINQIHQGLKEKKFSVLELVQFFLKKIEKENKKIFAYLTIDEEKVLTQAKQIDQLIAKRKEFPLLTGVPIAVKDNILVKDMLCTAGSKILANYLAPYDATVIKKLKEQNAIILGKTNLDEFAMGSSTENSAFGPTHNPHDLNRVPGGSSGGSAAAVAAALAVAALGSDTGGSIRLPAAFCGVVGLKPTYGAVSRYGLIAFASSLDQIGPFTKNVTDAKIIFEAIKGKDELDSTSVDLSKIKKEKVNLKEIRIGLPKEYFVEGIDPAVEKVIKDVIKKYEAKGVKFEEVSLPHTKYALACYYLIAPAEASANLARYDGIKYGFSTNAEKEINNLLDVYLTTRGQGFGAEVKRRIMLGTYVLSAGYYEAYYLKAQQVRAQIIKDFEKAFQKVTALFAPVSPFLPFKIGEKIDQPLAMYLVDIYTVSVNLAGLPALSLPVGYVNKLPVGLQIIGQPFEENKILEIAQNYEA